MFGKEKRLFEIEYETLLMNKAIYGVELTRVGMEELRQKLEWNLDCITESRQYIEEKERLLKELKFIYYTRHGVFP